MPLIIAKFVAITIPANYEKVLLFRLSPLLQYGADLVCLTFQYEGDGSIGVFAAGVAAYLNRLHAGTSSWIVRASTGQ